MVALDLFRTFVLILFCLGRFRNRYAKLQDGAKPCAANEILFGQMGYEVRAVAARNGIK